MYRPLPEGLIIRKSNYLSDITGNNEESGLFSTTNFPAGTRIGMSHIKDDRPEFENGLIRTPLGGFFNHNSNNPNCKVVHEEIYSYLETIKDIKPGEELTATYTIYNPEEGIENRKLKNLMKRNPFYEKGKSYKGLGKYLGIVKVFPHDEDYYNKVHQFSEKPPENSRGCSKINEIFIKKIKRPDK